MWIWFCSCYSITVDKEQADREMKRHVTKIPDRLSPSANEQPEKLPKSSYVILLPLVQLRTKLTWSDYNNDTPVLSCALKINRNHLHIMKNVTVWKADGTTIAIYSWSNCNYSASQITAESWGHIMGRLWAAFIVDKTPGFVVLVGTRQCHEIQQYEYTE